ncbi:MAG: pentapeptide repeat-containing protein [Cyanobium sp.]
MSQLIIEKDLINASRSENNLIVDAASDVIRARTLSVLRSFRLDSDRKASVIFFLIETEVLHSLKVSLDGANLRGANLSGANLSAANLEHIKWDEKTQWPDRSRFQEATNIPEALKQQKGL